MTVAFSDYIAFFTLLFFCAGCTTEPHKAAGTESNAMIAEPPENTGIKVTRTIQLSGIPSGSGMVAANGILYIIGDDSPFLYRLDKEYNQLPPVTIFKTSLFGSGRIAKKDKPDLEALSSIEINNQTFLLAIGSGSSENRQKAYLINLASEKPEVEEISLAVLFAFLKTQPGIAKQNQLNIEGLTVTADAVFLMQRGVGKGRNSLLKINKTDFIKILKGGDARNLQLTVIQLDRPEINGIQGGFSGLTCFDNQLFATASVENTLDPVQDGEVLGSFAGSITESGQTKLWPVKAANGKIVAVKAESIAVIEKVGNTYKAMLVTDDDKGGSELLEVDIRIG